MLLGVERCSAAPETWIERARRGAASRARAIRDYARGALTDGTRRLLLEAEQALAALPTRDAQGLATPMQLSAQPTVSVAVAFAHGGKISDSTEAAPAAYERDGEGE
jgi:hypothetical protein